MYRCSFLFRQSAAHRDLHSFPTRRSSDLPAAPGYLAKAAGGGAAKTLRESRVVLQVYLADHPDRKSTRLNSSHVAISYAVFCLKKKKTLPSVQLIVMQSITHQPARDRADS